jgi:CubicO group peptidase (beta-lactamase class C family)
MIAGHFPLRFAVPALLSTFLWATPGFAQAPTPLTAEDLSAYLDGMLPPMMATGDIAGAVVVVVKDDHLLFSKGYGYSNVEKRTPVDPEKTLFRPGSVSKLFTWTAVMQQVQEGKIDLDGDINQYLDFKVNGYGGKPITVRHLMTHTPGLEERLKNLIVYDTGELRTLEVKLKEGVPEPIFPPGSVPAYSNYGASLAGYIVQRVSGIPFEQYVEQKIFGPLGMNDSTFRQPLPKSLAPQMSTGYLQASAEKTVPFELVSDQPAGSLSASATNMASFMLAHLNGGYLPQVGESSRILSEKTTELMHSKSNTVAPGIDGMALGFYEQNRNGIRAIAHGGDVIAFHSDLLLIPEARVGLFMSFNSVGRNRATYALRSALVEGFTDRYFPRQQPLESAKKDAAGSKERTQAVAGSYELSRRAESSLFSLVYLLGQTGAHVTDNGRLVLEALTGPNEKPREFEEVSPWYWREVNGQMGLAAVRDADGKIKSLVPDGYGPIFVFQPVPGWRSKSWLQPAIALGAVIVLIGSIAWGVGAIRRRVLRRRGTPLPAAPNSRWPLFSRLAGVLSLLFIVLVGATIAMMSGDSLWILTDGAVPFLRLVQLSALLAVIGAIASVIAAVWSWRGKQEGRWRSVGRSLTALACLVFAYLALAFHFLSPSLQY